MNPPGTPLVVTAGDPAGIGPDICVMIGGDDSLPPLVVVGDEKVLRERAEMLGVGFALEVVHVPCPAPVVCGQPEPANAAALLDGLRLAVDGCVAGTFRALVTAPIAKNVIIDSGVPGFTGHTEFLAEQTGAEFPVMMLVAGTMRVALATVHLPLREVPDALTQDRLRRVLDVLHEGLRSQFGIDNPEIVVCGLNPHAGESGHLGHEDAAVIAPLVSELVEAGRHVRGPVPADTAFLPVAGERDALLAMYHDQGLPVIKYAGFGQAVNVTLGLPIVRTSVDHGTAFDLAGSGDADAGSLRAAIELAATLNHP